MCGRFVWIEVEGTFLKFRIIGNPDERPQIQRVFGQEHEAVHRWNIAPKQELVVIQNETGSRQAEWMQWGLKPFWSVLSELRARPVFQRKRDSKRQPVELKDVTRMRGI